MKTILFKLPEYYLIIIAFLTGYTPPFYINPIFAVIIFLLILQIIFKHRISGLIIGALFFFVNLYFLGALLSEFYEFTEFNSSAKKLLFVGLSIWVSNLVFSGGMFYKYAVDDSKNQPDINFNQQNI